MLPLCYNKKHSDYVTKQQNHKNTPSTLVDCGYIYKGVSIVRYTATPAFSADQAMTM